MFWLSGILFRHYMRCIFEAKYWDNDSRNSWPFRKRLSKVVLFRTASELSTEKKPCLNLYMRRLRDLDCIGLLDKDCQNDANLKKKNHFVSWSILFGDLKISKFAFSLFLHKRHTYFLWSYDNGTFTDLEKNRMKSECIFTVIRFCIFQFVILLISDIKKYLIC